MTNKILLDCEIAEAAEKNFRKNISKSFVTFILALCMVMSVCAFSVLHNERPEGEIQKSASVAERIEEAIYF